MASSRWNIHSATNSLSKWETRDFPTVKDNFTKKNKDTKLVIFSFAALLVLYSGKSEVAFTANDTAEFVDFIQSTFNTNDIKGWVEGIVKNKNIWKEDFAAIPFFIEVM